MNQNHAALPFTIHDIIATHCRGRSNAMRFFRIAQFYRTLLEIAAVAGNLRTYTTVLPILYTFY
ncbi:hypothetical protein L211DRAFT_4815 [Terfezia boudieri ATCC MYA-4762]|uniref:Uncharacterized protein n=1 Tax=Terfezia boudieri ATCC MYA-4762 TaxID=1051890 RepID=A0A3N4MAX9_9PEZI|nr:hypothetical protein L211DRAFT_4815 [Terfezia boudieri ATCC MYA-4762]